MKTLLIVESPSKATTIKKYLGADYEVVASVGHVRDLPKSDKDAIDIDAGFVPKYEISKGKEKVITDIKKAVKKVDTVLLATDPDREGEAIAWHLKEALDLKDAKRVLFYEITKEAVQEAVQNPREIDEDLRKAQEARRVLDRLFGYNLSKLIWTKVRYGLSAGRVQSPALRILMEREREIRAFIPTKYFELNGIFKTSKGDNLAECETIFEDKKEVDRILKDYKKNDWSISSIKKATQKRRPKPPFITSTIQQTANSTLGWSPSNTMRVAQKLYEAGHITYMRTDSVNLSKQAAANIKGHIEEFYGKDKYQSNVYKSRSKNAQEAHEAIRPTDVNKKIIGRTEEEKSLYNLIYARTVSSQMIDAELLKTTITFESHNMPKFLLRGSIIVKEGWLEVDHYSRNKETILPEFTEDEKVECLNIEAQEKETSPLPRYSEAGLIKELESRGIGRPSTYASTIRTIVERSYVEKQNRTLFPTKLGDVVSTFVENNFTKYIDDEFTSNMEETLDDIAIGKKQYLNTIKTFYYPFIEELDKKKDVEKLTTLGEADQECPKCKGDMTFKLSKHGVFMSCAKFPDCMGARTEEGEEMKEPELIGKKCPKCRDGELVSRMGRFGSFVSCNRYPKCKHIEEDEEELKRKDTGVKCLECKDGTLIERKGRFGIFFSCSGYPTCKYTQKARPTGDKCDECGSLMMEGTKTIPTRCAKKDCPMHNPHKLNK